MINCHKLDCDLSRSQVTTFNLQAYLSSRRAAVDRALERYVQEQQSHSQAIWQAMRYGLFPGGKRIRPILTLAAGELFGGKHKLLLPFACAIEMIHAYSLIHDDLPARDDDDLRRGAPTAHRVFGEGLALLAGDGLLTEAFCLMSSSQVARLLPSKLLVQLIHDVGHAVGAVGLVGGQALDLKAEDDTVDLAKVEYIHVRKTGALILAALQVGARAAGAAPADVRRVVRYGEFLGLAFQIGDDILDAEGEVVTRGQGETGRKECRKATYPSVVGIVQAKERLTDLVQQAVKQLTPFGGRSEPLTAIAEYVGARALHGETTSNLKEMQH
jgi:geranylgeranyl diphosphate synthase, type II